MISVCCVTDDKPGHKSQLDGLLEALKRRTDVREQWLHINQPGDISKPLDLILCVGRRTHWPALKLRWRKGGKVIALSRSWVPLWLFDLNILPEHDGVAESRRVFTTLGSMNAIRVSNKQDLLRGLILIGGPSSHYDWDSEALLQQVLQLTSRCSFIRWTLTTSRRTPEACAEQLSQRASGNFEFVPFADTNRDWLLQQYSSCGVIWVTEDSVSMVCESLSSGALVGVLQVPRLKSGRVSNNLDQLVESGRVLTLEQVNADTLPAAPTLPPLQEADKAAERVLTWLGHN